MDTTTAAASSQVDTPQRYDNIHISGHARVLLGNNYALHSDLFESGTEQQRRKALYNALNYAGANTKRDHIDLVEVGPDSFKWVADSKIFDWLRSGDTPFWIAGKPGSGKSTLMRYLIDSRSTLQQLNASGQHWTIVHFFFDFRAGEDLANQPLGMVKLFLRQLMQSVPIIARYLDDQDVHQRLLSSSIDDSLDVLVEALRSADTHVCAFVDGLDEHEGSLWDLCAFLETLRDRTGMKMCFASRSESEIREAFQKWPAILMQDYNNISVTAYLDRKLVKHMSYLPKIQQLFNEEVRDDLLNKAQGVMLWAKFVVDELVESCTEVTTVEAVLELLEGTPANLDDLYQRILQKIPHAMLSDVALLLHLLTSKETSTPYDLEQPLLYQAIAFIQTSHGKNTFLGSTLNEFSMDFRTKAILGSLLDFVPDKYGNTIVRSIHLSFDAYLRDTKWISTNLSRDVHNKYPDLPWSCLVCDVVQHLEQVNTIDMTYATAAIHEIARQAQQLPYDVYWSGTPGGCELWYSHFLRQATEKVSESTWSQLYLYAITRGPYAVEECPLEANEDRLERTTFMLRADVMLLHIDKCVSCSQITDRPVMLVRLANLIASGALPLYIALTHDHFAYLDKALASGSWSNRVLDDLMDSIMWTYNYIKYLRRNEAFGQFMQVLAERGSYVDCRHLCGMIHAPDIHFMWVGTVYACMIQNRNRNVWLREHSRDCQYFNTGVGFLPHWYLKKTRNPVISLDLLRDLGEDVTTSIVLDLPKLVEEPNQWPTNNALLTKVLALADAGATPPVESLGTGALSRAREMKWKWRWYLDAREYEKNADVIEQAQMRERIESYYEELVIAVDVFKIYTRTGPWPANLLEKANEYCKKERTSHFVWDFITDLERSFPEQHDYLEQERERARTGIYKRITYS
ncbi:hypothetical protein LTS08_003588 [Lithohypha guttulata]|nr:hypothetical protein LTS08_003588 [Lithohypha guttulata]